MSEQVAALLALQSPTGAFGSILFRGEMAIADWNCFSTAHVLRALSGLAGPPALQEARARALGFLVRCQSPGREGAFSFWPHDARPAWATRIPDDADDTAMCLLELALHGRLDRLAARKAAVNVLLRHTLRDIEPPAPPWLRPGVFVTWLRAGPRPNVVDCCVNANVVALLAYAGLDRLKACSEACAMIEAAVQWAGQSRSRAASLTPFYPHPAELLYAVRHAVQLGARQLERSLDLLDSASWTASDGSHALCSSAYGRDTWVSEAVVIARRLREGASFGSPGSDRALPAPQSWEEQVYA